MKKTSLTLVFISLFAFLPNAQVIIKVKPVQPKIIIQKPLKLKANHIWVSGHWVYHKKKKAYVWKEGYSVKSKRGKIWVPGHWVTMRNGHKWVPGYWRRK